MADAKAELVKLIDQVTNAKNEIQKLSEERTKLTAKLDSRLQTLYTELDALYEKKRLCENKYLEDLRATPATN